MTEFEIIKAIDGGAGFYLKFFGDAEHMQSVDCGTYRMICPKDGEAGIRFIFDIRFDELTGEEAAAEAAKIRSLDVPVWWPLYPVASGQVRDAVYGREYQPKPPEGGDEFYMAMLPENRPVDEADNTVVRRVQTAADFEVWAEMGNRIFAGGYQDIYPQNHFRWCKMGRLYPYIAFCGDRPAAIASILNNNGIASLEFVATLPEYRRRGFARAASVTAIREAFDNGVKMITLRAFYPAAVLYRQLGFIIYSC